jgi:hypothetical protein
MLSSGRTDIHKFIICFGIPSFYTFDSVVHFNTQPFTLNLHQYEKIIAMKTTRLLFVIAALFAFSRLYADIIPDNSHYVTKCAKITNVDDYPEVALVGYIYAFFSSEYDSHHSYLITDSSCLDKEYKLNGFSIYAVLKSYVIGKDVENMDFVYNYNAIISSIQIEPEGDYYDNSIPVNSIAQYYKIIGFTDSTVVLFKWKEVTGYNNGTPDSTKIFDYKADSAALSQQFPEIPTKLDPWVSAHGTKLYPNPNRGNLILQMENNFLGEVYVEFYSLDGRVAKSYLCNKTNMNGNFTIPTHDLKKGTYIVSLRYGGMVESQKIIVN